MAKYWYYLTPKAYTTKGRVVVNENGIIVHTESYMREYLGERIKDHPEWILQQQGEFTDW